EHVAVEAIFAAAPRIHGLLSNGFDPIATSVRQRLCARPPHRSSSQRAVQSAVRRARVTLTHSAPHGEELRYRSPTLHTTGRTSSQRLLPSQGEPRRDGEDPFRLRGSNCSRGT